MPILDIKQVQSWELGEVDLQIEEAVQRGNVAALIQALLQTATSSTYVRGFVTWVAALAICRGAIEIDIAHASFPFPAECKAEHLHGVRALALERFRDASAAARNHWEYSESRINELRKNCEHGVLNSARYSKSQKEKLEIESEELKNWLKYREILARKLSFFEKNRGRENLVVSEILAGRPAASACDGIKYSACWVDVQGSLQSVPVVSPRIYDLLGWPQLMYRTREEKRFARKLEAQAKKSDRFYKPKSESATKRGRQKMPDVASESDPQSRIAENVESCDLGRAVGAGNTLALIDGLLYFNSLDLRPPPYLALAAANVLIALYRDGGSLAEISFLSLSDCKAAYRHGRRWRMVQAWFNDIPLLNASLTVASEGKARQIRQSHRAAIGLAAKAASMAGMLLNRPNEDSEATIKKSCKLLTDHPEMIEQYWEPSLFLGVRSGFFPENEEMGKFFDASFSAMRFESA